jgi:mRNA-degrading endonuclease YafQ of YafQ-DinJ toxin-antitoxin module
VTKIVNTPECEKKFKEDFKRGKFSTDDGRVLKAWAMEMEEFGPEYIENSPQWRDHPLEREWKGYRASCFSLEGRIIYRILNENEIEICEIERITPDHDYKKHGAINEKEKPKRKK